MDHQISKLVKRGHDVASELNASCGSVDVRAVAQLLSDLATQLDVNRVALTESRREFTAANATIHNLELKVCELKLKGLECVREASSVYSKYNDTQMPDRDIVDMQALQELHDICKADDVGDALLAEVRYQGRVEGINFAASRIAAAYNNGFIDKPLEDVDDVVRAILSAKGELGNNLSEDGLSGEYAEKSLVEFAAQLRQGAKQ